MAPAVSILVTAWLLERQRHVLFGATLATNALATVAMLIGPALPQTAFPGRSYPFARASGWKDLAASVRQQLAKDHYGALVVDARNLAAELSYYLRDSNVPLFVIGYRDGPANHFEMVRSYRAGRPGTRAVRVAPRGVGRRAQAVQIGHLPGVRDNSRQWNKRADYPVLRALQLRGKGHGPTTMS